MSGSDEGSPGTAKPEPSSSWTRPSQWTLPPWLDHFNSHDVKILFRCWVATWVSMLLIFIQPSIENFGQAAFFAALLTIIVPPATVVFAYIMATWSLLLGMCVAWAWGMLTMKAAMAARPASDLQAGLANLEQQAAAQAQKTGQTASWEATILVHDGVLLDARVTTVYWVMGLAFIYVLARLRCMNPKLFFAQLFGTIVTDIYLLFAPGLPSYDATLASLLVKPGAAGVALGTACCILLFPHSTSYAVLDKMEKLIRMLDGPLKSTEKSFAEGVLNLAETKAWRAKIIMLYKSFQPSLAFLPLDISRGRWNADDVKEINSYIREVMVAGLSMVDFHITAANVKARDERLEKHQAAREQGSDKTGEKEANHIGARQLSRSVSLMNALKNPEKGAMESRAFDTLARTTTPTLQLCSKAVELTARCFHTVNSCRWIRKPPQSTFDGLIRELEEMIAALEVEIERCASDTTEGVIESFADLWDEDGELKDPDLLGPPSMKGISISMILEERILNGAGKILALLQFTLKLMQKRTTHRIWFPSKLRYALNWLSSGKDPLPAVNSGSVEASEELDSTVNPDTLEEQASEAYRRLRVSQGYPGSAARRNAVSRAILASWNWLFNTSGMFAIRVVLVTFVTAIPAVIPHSAGFFYREKGIWVVITAQLWMVVYMADFTFGILLRIVGTTAGGIVGMIAWYIGSGSGKGNPYGMAASAAVFLVPIMWLRLWLPPVYTKATILFGVTFLLVVGFSYDTHHLTQYGLPGTGYAAFWKRLVNVLLGCLAAAIVQMLPKPPSSTNHVRNTLANTVKTLSDHYALLLSHWGRKSDHSPLRAIGEEISLAVANALLGLNEPISQLKFEFTFSPFDQKVLGEVKGQCEYLNQSLRRLLNLSTNLPIELQERLSLSVGFMDDRSIGDIMAVLDIIEQSLRTGSPLPERLPTPLVSRFYESWESKHHHAVLTVALVRDEHYRRYCVAMSAYLKMLGNIDELVLILKSRLGESHVIHRWEDA